MSTQEYPGIDYGLGQSNVDTSNGLRFGVISANSLCHYFWEEVETEYDPYCPSCGDELSNEWDGEDSQVAACELHEVDEDHENETPICPSCGKCIDDGEQYGDEPSRSVINKDGYEGHVDDHNDVWLTKSPFYTNAQFCSPCAPGAGHLDNPIESGPKTYCFGHDWFEGGLAPYPVYDVKDGARVMPV